MLRLLINLDSSQSRLRKIDAQLRNLSVPYERVPAINGKNLANEYKNEIVYPIDHFKTKVRFTRALSDGEIGCFLSHIKCWEKLINSEEDWALVMEDDIQISSLAGQYLNSDKWLPENIDICQLSSLNSNSCGRIKAPTLRVDNFLSLVQPIFPPPLGTQAYFISRAFAKRAIELSHKLPAPVDNFMFSYWFELATEFRIWRTNPILVIPQSGTASEIGDRKGKNMKKAPFWIRHGLTRLLLDHKIKKLQKKGIPFYSEFLP